MTHVKDEIKKRLDALYEEALALEDELHWINHDIEDLEQQLEDAED